jgi:hypothetical protein
MVRFVPGQPVLVETGGWAMKRSNLRSVFDPRRGLIVLLAAALAMFWAPGIAQGAVEENVTIPVEGEVFEDLCGEDLIHTGGNLHILFTYTINDNHVSGNVHFQPQAAKLVGLTTGREWVGTGMLHESFSESLEDGAATFTSVSNFRIIGKGMAPSYIEQIILHTTINANGDVTSDFSFAGVACT